MATVVRMKDEQKQSLIDALSDDRYQDETSIYKSIIDPKLRSVSQAERASIRDQSKLRFSWYWKWCGVKYLSLALAAFIYRRKKVFYN